jgi:hypothetical protein
MYQALKMAHYKKLLNANMAIFQSYYTVIKVLSTALMMIVCLVPDKNAYLDLHSTNETILLNSATVIILDPTIYQNNVCCFCGKQAALRATSGLIGSA